MIGVQVVYHAKTVTAIFNGDGNTSNVRLKHACSVQAYTIMQAIVYKYQQVWNA